MKGNGTTRVRKWTGLVLGWWSTGWVKLAAMGIVLLLVGCGQVEFGPRVKPAVSGEGRVEATDGPGAESEGVAGVMERLEGKTTGEVRSILGQPHGRLRSQDGTVWLYSGLRVLFDPEGQVKSVEGEESLEAQASTSATAVGGLVLTQPVTVIADGGLEVNLARYLPAGKVTIVDFYADWCGPCRRIGPKLEQLALSDPEVVLVKVDIVKWGTPVTRQFQIRSVPSVHVYNRRGHRVGNPTSDFEAVRRSVEHAKKTS
jgi:thiol-disulfide isomerase/thioredoxin